MVARKQKNLGPTLGDSATNTGPTAAIPRPKTIESDAKRAPLSFRPTSDVRFTVDEMVREGVALSAADAVNQLIRIGKTSKYEHRQAIAQACGGKNEVALGIALARIAGAVSQECKRDFIKDREVFEQVRLAINMFLDLIEPQGTDPRGLFEAPAITIQAAETVIDDVKVGLHQPDKNYWPFADTYYVDENLDKRLLPLESLVKLYAHWADIEDD